MNYSDELMSKNYYGILYHYRFASEKIDNEIKKFIVNVFKKAYIKNSYEKNGEGISNHWKKKG